MAEWFAYHFEIKFKREFSASDAVCLACQAGHVDVVQWLFKGFDLSSSDALDRARALRFACVEQNDIVFAQWLCDAFHITAGDARSTSNETLRLLCERGQLEVAQWLARKFQLTASDARCTRNYALRYACKSGHLDVAKWLVSTFHLRAEDIRDVNNHAIREACAHGHLDVARWLVDTFSLTANDVRACASDNVVLREACSNGHLDVAQWLVGAKFFALGTKKDDGDGDDDGKKDDDDDDDDDDHDDDHDHDYDSLSGNGDDGRIELLYEACAKGHLEVAQWLTDDLGIHRGHRECSKPVDSNNNNNFPSSRSVADAFCKACENGHLITAEWLVSKFCLIPADREQRQDRRARAKQTSESGGKSCCEILTKTKTITITVAINAFRMACKNGHVKVAKWLMSTFQLTREDARTENSGALRLACENGHLETAKWLTATFHLTAEQDLRACDNHALRMACQNGHLNVVRWWIGAQTRAANVDNDNDNDNGDDNDNPTTTGAAANHTRNNNNDDDDMLSATSFMRSENARAFVFSGIRYACLNGHLAVAKWLYNALKLATAGRTSSKVAPSLPSSPSSSSSPPSSSPSPPANYGLALLLEGVCSRGYFAIAQWLVDTFEIITAKQAAQACRMACCVQGGELAQAGFEKAGMRFYLS